MLILSSAQDYEGSSQKNIITFVAVLLTSLFVFMIDLVNRLLLFLIGI